MIKGVNRRIIEVNDTDNKYFERAMLFVSPTYAEAEESKLKKEADEILSRFSASPCPPSARRGGRRKARLLPALCFAGGILCGAGGWWLLSLVL